MAKPSKRTARKPLVGPGEPKPLVRPQSCTIENRTREVMREFRAMVDRVGDMGDPRYAEQVVGQLIETVAAYVVVIRHREAGGPIPPPTRQVAEAMAIADAMRLAMVRHQQPRGKQ